MRKEVKLNREKKKKKNPLVKTMEKHQSRSGWLRKKEN